MAVERDFVFILDGGDEIETKIVVAKGEKGDKGDPGVALDPTLSKAGEAAEAKATGEAIKAEKEARTEAITEEANARKEAVTDLKSQFDELGLSVVNGAINVSYIVD